MSDQPNTPPAPPIGASDLLPDLDGALSPGNETTDNGGDGGQGGKPSPEAGDGGAVRETPRPGSHEAFETGQPGKQAETKEGGEGGDGGDDGAGDGDDAPDFSNLNPFKRGDSRHHILNRKLTKGDDAAKENAELRERIARLEGQLAGRGDGDEGDDNAPTDEDRDAFGRLAKETGFEDRLARGERFASQMEFKGEMADLYQGMPELDTLLNGETRKDFEAAVQDWSESEAWKSVPIKSVAHAVLAESGLLLKVGALREAAASGRADRSKTAGGSPAKAAPAAPKGQVDVRSMSSKDFRSLSDQVRAGKVKLV